MVARRDADGGDLKMPTFVPKPAWADLDFSAKVKTWQQNRAATQVASGNSKLPIESLRQSVNHLAAYHPAMLFTHSPAIDYSYFGSADPLLQWQSYDYQANNRDFTINMIFWSSGNDDAYFYREDDTNYRSGSCNENWHWTPQFIQCQRNSPTLDFTTEGLSQVADGNIRLVDICVQENRRVSLDTDEDTCVSPSGHRDMSSIRATELEAIRSTFHDVRTRNMPMAICWSAQTDVECSETQASDYVGVAISETAPVNIWDLASTTRTATTPGSHATAYRSAVGNETNSTLAKVLCKARARVIDNSGDPEGYVRFIGPDHVADNFCDISVTDTSFGWVGGGADDFIYLNSAVDYDYAGTEKNKIDIHGYVTSTDVLQVVGVVGWRVYE